MARLIGYVHTLGDNGGTWAVYAGMRQLAEPKCLAQLVYACGTHTVISRLIDAAIITKHGWSV